MVRWGYCGAALLVLSLSAAEEDVKLKVTLQQIKEDYFVLQAEVLRCLEKPGDYLKVAQVYSNPSQLFLQAAMHVHQKLSVKHMSASCYYEELLRPHGLTLDKLFHERFLELGSTMWTWKWFHLYIAGHGFEKPFDEYSERLVQQAKTKSAPSAPSAPASLAAAVASAGPSASSDEQPGLPKSSAPVAESEVVVSRAGSL